MKFVMKQEKLEELLEKLIVKDIFPSAIITVKDGSLFSIQKEEHARALRFLLVKETFFDEIESKGAETIELDVERTLNTVKNILPNTVLTFETKGNKVSIKGENVNANISYRDPESDVLTTLKDAKIEIIEGVPHVGDSKLPLDINLEIKLSDFKDLAGYASSLKTEFYKFYFDGAKLAVRIGDLHDFSDYVIYNPKTEIKTGTELAVIFTYGVPQVADTFRKSVNISTKTNAPAWIYESDEHYTLGILIPPYVVE